LSVAAGSGALRGRFDVAIVGVQSVTFGAKEPSKIVQFFDDFGLHRVSAKDGAVDYQLEEGSQVHIRGADDPTLPPPFLPSDGPREVIWGVDSKASLDELGKLLKGQADFRADADGTLHLRDPIGLRIGFRLFERKPVTPAEAVENTLTHRPRWNTVRKWYDRANPKVIQHVVFATENIQAAIDFYVGKLKFRVSDVSRGRGIFLRAEGRNEHHNLFFVNRPLAFHHMAFGVDSIDELMAGSNYMQRQGWRAGFGLGRHRVSSIVYFYLSCPTGGEIEYAADGDFLDDNWKPRLWEASYGNQHWLGQISEQTMNKPVPDVHPLPEPLPSFAQMS
jgi:catechol 2,3-dioxygenase-like lactoylglutathione lyase family enzyme